MASGEYASSSEIVREALRHWRRQRELQAKELGALFAADQAGRAGDWLRLAWDRALVLIGFWRGFQPDEPCLLQAEHIDVVVGEGMVISLLRSKSDLQARNREYKAPALSRL